LVSNTRKGKRSPENYELEKKEFPKISIGGKFPPCVGNEKETNKDKVEARDSNKSEPKPKEKKHNKHHKQHSQPENNNSTRQIKRNQVNEFHPCAKTHASHENGNAGPKQKQKKKKARHREERIDSLRLQVFIRKRKEEDGFG